MSYRFSLVIPYLYQLMTLFSCQNFQLVPTFKILLPFYIKAIKPLWSPESYQSCMGTDLIGVWPYNFYCFYHSRGSLVFP